MDLVYPLYCSHLEAKGVKKYTEQLDSDIELLYILDIVHIWSKHHSADILEMWIHRVYVSKC